MFYALPPMRETSLVLLLSTTTTTMFSFGVTFRIVVVDNTLLIFGNTVCKNTFWVTSNVFPECKFNTSLIIWGSPWTSAFPLTA
mmetsp:Transcript_29213/g.41802  ORF Transcript_29213/g.41802 Transcript_29213/m.41802 type:complete len:84 (+) Transcript_29213:101-352(+)